MNSLDLQSRRISVELPVQGHEYHFERRHSGSASYDESEDDLCPARGMLIALGLSALMWIIVLATVTFF